MIRSKLVLAVTTVAAAGVAVSTVAAAGTEPVAEEGGSGAVTLEEACAAYDGLQAPEGFRVNLVTDIGKIDDGTFNQFAHEGMLAANECFGIANSSTIETATEADYASNIATSLESNPNVLVTVGFLLTDATLEAATTHPDTNFIGVDQFLPEYPENMAGEQFAEDEAGYVAGVFAASLSETGVIGVIGGLESVPPVVKFVNGYIAGATATNPDIVPLSIYSDSFTEPQTGASHASQFIGEGADVIFGAGGQTGSGGVAAAAAAGVWGIGVDKDEYFSTFAGGTAPGSDHLATSAVKRVDLATFELIASAVQGDFTDGLYFGNAANGMIGLAPSHDADIPAEVTDAANAALAGLADGSISTGLCGIDGKVLADGGTACDAATDGTAATEGTTA